MECTCLSEAVLAVGVDIQLGTGADGHVAEGDIFESDHFAVSDNDVRSTDGVGESLIAVEGQSTGVCNVGSDNHIA